MADILSPPDPLPPVNGWWVTGLVDGEGCFYAGLDFREKTGSYGKTYPCVSLDAKFEVCLRADDLGAIQKLKSYFGCGAIYTKFPEPAVDAVKKSAGNKRPQKSFQIRNPLQLVESVLPHFARFPLQSKKARDFEIWRSLLLFSVAELVGHKGWLRRYPDKVRRLSGLCDSLREVRSYRDPLTVGGVQ